MQWWNGQCNKIVRREVVQILQAKKETLVGWVELDLCVKREETHEISREGMDVRGRKSIELEMLKR